MSKIVNTLSLIPNKSKYTHPENEIKSKACNETHSRPLADITHKFVNAVPPAKELKKHKAQVNPGLNTVHIPSIEAVNQKIKIRANPDENEKKHCAALINPLKRAQENIGKELYENPLKCCKPVGTLVLRSDDEKIKSLWPIFNDVDCGFNWKVGLKIFSGNSDDDHKTPEEMIEYTSCDVMNELRSVLKTVDRLGWRRFNEDLENYKRHRRQLYNSHVFI